MTVRDAHRDTGQAGEREDESAVVVDMTMDHVVGVAAMQGLEKPVAIKGRVLGVGTQDVCADFQDVAVVSGGPVRVHQEVQLKSLRSIWRRHAEPGLDAAAIHGSEHMQDAYGLHAALPKAGISLCRRMIIVAASCTIPTMASAWAAPSDPLARTMV